MPSASSNVAHFMVDYNWSFTCLLPLLDYKLPEGRTQFFPLTPSVCHGVGAVRPSVKWWVHLCSQNTLNALNSIWHCGRGILIIYVSAVPLNLKSSLLQGEDTMVKTAGLQTPAPMLLAVKMMERGSFSSYFQKMGIILLNPLKAPVRDKRSC